MSNLVNAVKTINTDDINLDPPETVPNLYAWWRSDSGVTKDNNDKVGIWMDRTANQIPLAQASPSYKPQFYTSQINGHASIRGFTDASTAMPLTTTKTFTVTGDFTIFMVCKSNDTVNTAGSRIAAVMGTANLSHYTAFYHPRSAIPANHWFNKYTGSDIISAYANTAGTMNAWKYLTWSGGSASNASYVNGAAQTLTYTTGNASTDGQLTQTTHFSIMGSPSLSGAYNGEFAEIIVYKKVLDSTERGIVHTYLAARYGL